MKYSGGVHDLSRKLMSDWYEEQRNARADGRKTAYLMISGNCVELLRAFDVVPAFPEVNALQIAIRKKSLPMILKAEEVGYSSDNCAYVKADIGMTLVGAVGEKGDIPVPDLIVSNFVGCNVYIKWFEHSAHFMDVPLFVVDIPFLREPEPVPSAADTRYVVEQLVELIGVLERLTGQKYDPDKLCEILRHSARAEEGWAKCKELCKARPAPFDAYFDSINMMGPINVLRGTPEAADFFDAAVAEFSAKVERKEGPISEERARVVFEGPPPYPYYRDFRDLFTEWGAVGVASTYSTVGGLWEFGFRHDPDGDPLVSIAEQMLVHNLTNRSMVERYKQIERYVKEWGAECLVIHSIKSCRLFSAGQGDMREYFIRSLGVPTLILESDLEDPRYYSHAQLKNRVDAFFEAFEHKKATA